MSMSPSLSELILARLMSRDAVFVRERFKSERASQEFCDFEFSWETARRRSRRGQ